MGSVCCVGVPSLDVVSMNFMIVPGMWEGSSLLISVYMFIVSKSLLILSVTVIVRVAMLDNFHMCVIILLLSAVINMLDRIVITRGSMCLGV